METTWLHTFQIDLHQSSTVQFYSTSEITLLPSAAHTYTNTCNPPHIHALLRVWQCRVKSCDAWELYTIHRLQWREKSPKCMKKHEAATVSMKQKKQQRKMSTTKRCWFLLLRATWTLVSSCFFPLALCIIFSSN